MSSFMPKTGENILRQVGVEDEALKTWDSLTKYGDLKNIKVISKGEPLFMRLDAEEEISYIKDCMKK